MKITWEENDIICGRIVTKEGASRANSHDSWRWKHTYKIGYSGGGSSYSPHTENFNESGLCMFAMTDGMRTQIFKSDQELADYLNKYNYILAPHDYIMGMMESMRDAYN